MGEEILLALTKAEEYMMSNYKKECLDEFIWLPEVFLYECAKAKLDNDYKEISFNTWDYIG